MCMTSRVGIGRTFCTDFWISSWNKSLWSSYHAVVPQLFLLNFAFCNAINFGRFGTVVICLFLTNRRRWAIKESVRCWTPNPTVGFLDSFFPFCSYCLFQQSVSLQVFHLRTIIAGKHMLLQKEIGFPSISQCVCANAHTVARPSSKASQPVTHVKAEPHGYAQGCSWNLHHPAIYFDSPIACLLSLDQYVWFLTW
jgi:hypothetical protein